MRPCDAGVRRALLAQATTIAASAWSLPVLAQDFGAQPPQDDYPEQQKAYSLLSARIGWTSRDGRIGLRPIGTNLSDRNYYLGTANYTPAIAARQGRPREAFGQVSLRF